MERIGLVLAHDVLTHVPVKKVSVQTPLTQTTGHGFYDRTALVPVMRAGDALLPAFRRYLHRPAIWHITLSRNESDLSIKTHGVRVPMKPPTDVGRVIILEIMLATGGSACTAVQILKDRGNKNISFVAVVAAPEGIHRLMEEHSDVEIYVLAIDERLTNEKDEFPAGFIWPGLGDAGDRMYPIE
jgi:uracil phosphoribosyltransferase